MMDGARPAGLRHRVARFIPAPVAQARVDHVTVLVGHPVADGHCRKHGI